MAGRISYYGNIVKDGLILCLDAAKKDSYPGTGTAWNDISGFRNNGVLTNGPTFSNANGGSIVFDGVDDFLTSTTLSSLIGGSITFTLIIWIYPTNLNNTNISGTGYKTLVDTPGRNLSIWMGTNGVGQFYGLGGSTSVYSTNFNWENNKWQMVTVIANISSGQIIKNNYTVSETIGKGGSLTSQLSFGNNPSGGGTNMGGSYGVIQFYNRALSATEVLQNYNATKGRYL
jgi:hypothetical protein